jgi:hypothetical protein
MFSYRNRHLVLVSAVLAAWGITAAWDKADRDRRRRAQHDELWRRRNECRDSQ